ncbi:hypothetical protein AXG93_406s1000 [Marchantia polymorpha subsp. ruderalis]|uniref:EVE domain-containing protein n=1 Tax=Marchantia polymorpha subsp. ruderalis TaxID=1480154 RepID=A0A176VBC3_MARPO|nr:hypothetical protein AXG93_406s1000 [Marchantia polymorpha subsp. ruderalis]
MGGKKLMGSLVELFPRQLNFQKGPILRKLREGGYRAGDCSAIPVADERPQMGNYWLLKTEPDCWSWDNQTANKGMSVWDGVRNHQAQNAMRNMVEGDLCFFYHTGKLKEVCGIVRVVKPFYPDPTDDTGKWGAVDVQEVVALKSPVTLAQMKEDDEMADFLMFRQPRLSVVPVEEDVWTRVCTLGEVEPPLLESSGEEGKKLAHDSKEVDAQKQVVKRPGSGRKKSADDGENSVPIKEIRKQPIRTKVKPQPVVTKDQSKATNATKTSSSKSGSSVNGNGVEEKTQPSKVARKRGRPPKAAAEEEEKLPSAKENKKPAMKTMAAAADKPRKRPGRKPKKAADTKEVASETSE